MDYREIRYDVDNGVATLTFDRPEKLNPFTERMKDELLHAFDRVDADDAVRVLVVTGAGRGFCAGADLSSGVTTFDADAQDSLIPDGEDWRDSGGVVTLRIFDLIKPVLAAINGPAIGIGATMTLAMDVRLMSETARYGFPFGRLGVVPEACSSWFLPRLVGISKAMEWVATGRIFDAQEARDADLVRSLHAPDELLPATYALAREIADNTSAVSVAMARQMMWKGMAADHPMKMHRVESKAFLAMGRSDDCKAGLEAFFARRPAEFPLKPSTDMPEVYPWWRLRAFDR